MSSETKKICSHVTIRTCDENPDNDVNTNTNTDATTMDKCCQFEEVVVQANQPPKVIFTVLSNLAEIPQYETTFSAGMDLTIVKEVKKLSADVTLYDTDLKVTVPHGYHTEIVGRSSISKTGHMLANNIGIIDSDYQGHLLIALYHYDKTKPAIQLPQRVAQLILRKTERLPVSVIMMDDTHSILSIDLKDNVAQIERGAGGFGSTGN